jgi:hypothetical protein
LDQDDDPFLSGAYFALSWATDVLFGDLLGALFFDEITSYEVLTENGWETA